MLPPGEQQSRLDGCVPPGAAAQRFPLPKSAAAAPCSAEWELREDEQREEGTRSCLQKEEDLGGGLLPIGSCQTHASKNGGGDGAASELAAKPRGKGGQCCSPGCKGRGSLETALTSQSGRVAF